VINVLGKTTVAARGCYTTFTGSLGCESGTYRYASTTMCYCKTDFCNGAESPKSRQHLWPLKYGNI